MRNLCLTALFLAACGGDAPPKITSATINPTHAKAAQSVTMTLEVEGFELAALGAHMRGLRANHGDETVAGHVHVYFDNTDTNPLVQTSSATFPIVIPGAAEVGPHKLIARLHTSDHLILMPEVKTEVALTVDAP